MKKVATKKLGLQKIKIGSLSHQQQNGIHGGISGYATCERCHITNVTICESNKTICLPCASDEILSCIC